MQVDFAFICDYADNTANKLSAIGIGFDTIYAPVLPWQHPTFHFVVQLRFTVAEAGAKSIELRLIDADGSNILPPVNGQIEVTPHPGQTEGIARLVLGLGGVNFPRHGSYAIHLVIQGVEVARVALKVQPPPTTA